jgi:hypothetical protein
MWGNRPSNGDDDAEEPIYAVPEMVTIDANWLSQI